MEMGGNMLICDELSFGIYFDLLGTENIEYIFGLQPAFVQLHKLVEGNFSLFSHLENP